MSQQSESTNTSEDKSIVITINVEHPRAPSHFTKSLAITVLTAALILCGTSGVLTYGVATGDYSLLKDMGGAVIGLLTKLGAK